MLLPRETLMLRYRKDLIELIRIHVGDSPLRGAEIGVWAGVTSAELIKAFTSLHLYMIDSYDPTYDLDGMKHEPFKIEEVLVQAVKNTIRRRKRRTLIIQNSIQASELFADGSMDFVFLDGSHFYEAIKADIEVWAPKVKKGGLVAGHDYGEFLARKFNCGVKQAVDEYATEHSIQLGLERGTIWWFLKC